MKQKKHEAFWKNINYSYISGKVKEESKHTLYGDCDCLGWDGATTCEALLGQGTHGAPAWRSDGNGSLWTWSMGVWYYKMLDFKWHQRSTYDAEGLRDRIFTYFCVQIWLHPPNFLYLLYSAFSSDLVLLQLFQLFHGPSTPWFGLGLWNDAIYLYHEIASECENHNIICIFIYIIYI